MAKKSSAEAPPMKLFYIFYSTERWNNWITTLREADFNGDPESEEPPSGFQALYSFTEDITIETLKIVKLFQNGRFTKEEALDKVAEVERIVMSEVPADEIGEMVESIQLSLLVLFNACRKYIEGGFDKDIKANVKKGRSIVEEDLEGALDSAGHIGASVIDGANCCEKFLKEGAGETTIFDEWLIEIETMKEELKSLKNFDETAGEED